MSAIVDFNSLVFIILLVANIILCIKKVPILGLAIGFMTIILCGAIFIDSIIINIYITYLLIIIGFSCMLINGLDFRRKK